jgi:putative effector of murein hydrolase LrgA (UPF0299 family)
MLRALAILLTCQLAGETITRALELPVPGPVLGLLILAALLFAAQRWWRTDPATIDGTDLGKVSNALIATLGILFVPAGVGVIQELDLFSRYGLALAVSVVVSTVLTMVVTVWVFVGVSRLVDRKSAGSED